MEYMQKQLTVMCKDLIDTLIKKHILRKNEYLFLIQNRNLCKEYLFEKAREEKEKYYGKDIYVRGLIEFTNICKNNCLYCGIRKDNKNIERYRLSEKEILDCAKEGYDLGFRTFVLQGGEDSYFTDERLISIISKIKKAYPDAAITLSIGERDYESYKRLREAGADRYLLRHESANKNHYKKIHPKEMDFDNRIKCIKELKSLGYQVGCGFMVGSPYQTDEMLAQELLFLKRVNPAMCGIGPFISHKDTPFSNEESGTAELTIFMLALIRLTIPKVLLPATTALGTIDPKGREKGIMAGANVLMPNLSPTSVRKKYMLYDNKICTGDESAACLDCLKKRIEKTGDKIVISRGDSKNIYGKEKNYGRI